MAGDVTLKESAQKRNLRKRSKRRIPVRIDMTPMVDIAFLLLIFYMVSTVFEMPQAIELNLPPDSQVVPVRYLLTIRVDSLNQCWWNMDKETGDNLPVMIPSKSTDENEYVFNESEMNNLIYKKSVEIDSLNTLILIDSQANYKQMINLLDEIELVERRINSERAAQYGRQTKNIPAHPRFFYRYAMGEWSDTDDRIILQAMTNLKKGGE